MLRTDKLSPLQIYFMLILVVGLVNHVTIIPLLLQASAKDAWMGVLLSLGPLLLWVLLIAYIAKATHQRNFMGWLRDRTGVWLSSLIAALLSLYLFANAYITLKETIMWIQVTFLPQTPITVTGSVLLTLCYYSSRKGIKSLAIASGFLLPAVLAFGYFVMGSNFQFKRYELLFPPFMNGVMPAVKSAQYVAASIMELIVLLILQHYLISSLKRTHLFVLVLVMGGLTIGPLMGAIATFGLESVQLRYPSYEQWRLVTIGSYIAHVDFLSIYQWLSGAFVRISLMVLLISEVWRIKAPRQKNGFQFGLCGLLLVLVVAPLSDTGFLKLLTGYYTTVFWYLLALSLLLFLIVYIQARKKGESQ
ncbi:endospore germination permease [Paenibacillus sp. GCM10012303]|uniref:endospore germination permease n=1 Tax=Paenibacillus sp. GCM10012303 TaxID=3317340 RepID=UPI0036155806